MTGFHCPCADLSKELRVHEAVMSRTVFKELLGWTTPHHGFVRVAGVGQRKIDPHDALILSQLDAHIPLGTVDGGSATLDDVDVRSEHLESWCAFLIWRR